jgi:hypothetical protein
MKAAGFDESKRLVFGYAIVCKVDGEDYHDLQGDHIAEDDMFDAVTEFTLSSRVAKEMHEGEQKGVVIFSFPMTEEIAKSLGMQWMPTTEDHQYGPGWIVGVRLDEATFAKVKSGELSGFSIGGSGRRTEIQEAA